MQGCALVGYASEYLNAYQGSRGKSNLSE